MTKLIFTILTSILFLSCKKDKNITEPIEPVESITGKLKSKETSNSSNPIPVRYDFNYNDKGKLGKAFRLQMINGNSYYDTMDVDKYVYDNKTVLYIGYYGQTNITYQLNDKWIAVSGKNIANHTDYVFTYNNYDQITEVKTITPRDNSTQTFYNNWYYSANVCDSSSFSTTWAGFSSRITQIYEYDLTKNNTADDISNIGFYYTGTPSIFGKKAQQYTIRKITYKNYTNNTSYTARLEYDYHTDGKISARKIWYDTNTNTTPDEMETFIYN